MKPVKGFTLIELMIVVGIIAILASIAVPAYNGYILRGKFAEAAGALAATRVKMEQYYQDNRVYSASATVGGGCISPATVNFTLGCTLTAPGYNVDAIGIAARGTGGFTFRLDQDNNKTTVAVPTGWSLPTSNTCWVQKKGGIC
jgi:type IV pilus assembly protein PilE